MNTTTRLAPVLCLLSGLASCVPWTVRPIENAEASSTGVSPAAFVDSTWQSKLLPSILQSAVDARKLLNAVLASPADAVKLYGRRDAGGPPYYVVKGKGTVTAVNLRSRVGFALIDIEPLDSKPDLSMQIGPVLRGTSLRDATGVIRFSDFVNQLQYADVASELNARVLKSILAPIDKAGLKGRTVSFCGALPALEKSEPPLAELVPVQLTIEEQR